jgi:myo-inositol-1(or 4)-monophosphatase
VAAPPAAVNRRVGALTANGAARLSRPRAQASIAAAMSPSPRDVAVDAARRAGALLLAELGGARSVEYKTGPTNLVTDMDRRAESLIVDALRAAFPDHAILTEEAGALAGSSRARWIVDPLDGTTNYAHGIPIFTVSIALVLDGRPQVGVVYDPARDECFVAERGAGAALNGRALRVSAVPVLDESVVATGFAYTIRQGRDTNLPEHDAISVRCRAVRAIGSAAMSLAWVAAGRFDGFWELVLGPWDVAAGSLLIEEAGGRVTDLAGGPVDLAAPAPVASNGRIHGELLAVLAASRPA